MARPRSKSSKATRTDELKNLSIEVLRLRLHSLNLPITASRARMLERLRLATNSAPVAIQRRSRSRPHNGQVHKNKSSASNIRVRPRPKPNVPSKQADAETHNSDEDGRSDVDSAVEELLEDFEPQVLQNAIFSPAQMSAIQETVSTSVNEALRVFNNHEAQARFSDDLRTPSPRILNTVTPLGLHRPLAGLLVKMWLSSEMLSTTLPLLICLLLFFRLTKKRLLTGWTRISCGQFYLLWVLALLSSHGSTFSTIVLKVLLMLMVICLPSLVYLVVCVKAVISPLCYICAGF